MLGLYSALTRVAARPARAWLYRRAARGKEDPQRLHERFGEPSAPRPDGPVVWIHAASVGESASVLSLITRLLETPALSVLLTSGTVSSARVMAPRLPPRALHQFAPVDLPAEAARFLDHWRPNLALFVESELWPNLLTATAARAIPLAIVQGRLSDRSWRIWRRIPGARRRVFSRFRLVIAQSPQDARRFRELGAPAVVAPGSLKYAAAPLPADPAALNSLRSQLAARPLWLAASTHPGGDEAAVLAAHKAARTRIPDLLTIIAPRHPERGDALAHDATARGLSVARRSRHDRVEQATALYIADTLGELGLFYRLAPVAFVGGSLSPRGGHNLIEPLQLGCVVLTGPDLRNFSVIAEDLRASGALCIVSQAPELAQAVSDLLLDHDARHALAARQKRVIDGKANVLDSVMAALAPCIPAP